MQGLLYDQDSLKTHTIAFPHHLTAHLILDFIATPYVFLLLVLQDMGVYDPQFPFDECTQEISGGDVFLAREILKQSFEVGLQRYPIVNSVVRGS